MKRSYQLASIKETIRAQLEAGNAAVYLADISDLSDYDPCLTQIEIERFERVVVADQRRAHALGRGLVRYFLDLPVADFSTNQNGKPGHHGYQFNISHSKQFIALAFHTSLPVGIDIEAQIQQSGHSDVVEFVCHPNEKKWIALQPRHEQEVAFIRAWVRKESYLKAIGIGLVDNLSSIDTRLESDFPQIKKPTPMSLWDISTPHLKIRGALAANPAVNEVVLACQGHAELVLFKDKMAP